MLGVASMEAPFTTAADGIKKYYALFFKENKAWHFMWIVCPADEYT